MTTVNEKLLDRTVRQSIFLERFKGGEAKRLLNVYRDLEKDLLAQLAAIDPTAVKGRYRQLRLQKLLDHARDIMSAFSDQLELDARDTLNQLGVLEAQFGIRTFESVVPIEWDWVQPSATQVRAAITAAPMQGRFLKDWYRALDAVAQDRVRSAIRLGVIEGQTIAEISTRIRNATGQARRGAEMVTRTAVNHVSQVARSLTYDANADIVKGVRWVSTLDMRTSAICRARDGQVYQLGSGPRPPGHPNCRSTITPVLKSWRELGIDVDDAPEGTRASMDGQVPASTTYSQWLKGQPAAVQDEVLGKAKGALFRRGGLSLDKFVMADGTELALDELRASYPKAFNEAGVWPGRTLMAQPKRERIVRDYFAGGYGAAVERADASRSDDARARLRLSEAENVMLWAYTTEGGRGLYSELNTALRSGEFGEVERGLRDALTAALRKLPVHRGVVERRVDLSGFPEVRRRLLAGEFADGGFISASIEGAMGGRPDVLVIQSRTGRKIAAWSSLKDETEVLFSPDSKFDIVSARLNERGGVTVELEELE